MSSIQNWEADSPSTWWTHKIFISERITDRQEEIPLRRNMKSAWSTVCLWGLGPEVMAPVGAGTCGYGGDGDDGEDDGGC
jgi:hypothetical protein